VCARRTGRNFDGRCRFATEGCLFARKLSVHSRQNLWARARRRSILSWRRHSSEQKQEPPATRFCEIWDLQRTQKRSIFGVESDTKTPFIESSVDFADSFRRVLLESVRRVLPSGSGRPTQAISVRHWRFRTSRSRRLAHRAEVLPGPTPW
jgi:hypothetical protein